MARMLGKRPPIPGLVVPQLKTYLKKALPPPPKALDRFTGVKFQPLGNTTVGNCTVAAWLNGVIQRTTIAQRVPLVATTKTALDIYSKITGYDPADPATDRGAIVTDVLKYFARTGTHLRAQSIEVGTWAALNNTPGDIRQAVHLFGSAYAGWQLPVTAQDQKVWDVVGQLSDPDSQPGSWGGHATACVGYSPEGVTLATWGATQQATWAFVQAYLDESYAVFAPGEWLATTGLSPDHFDFSELLADHHSLAA